MVNASNNNNNDNDNSSGKIAVQKSLCSCKSDFDFKKLYKKKNLAFDNPSFIPTEFTVNSTTNDSSLMKEIFFHG